MSENPVLVCVTAQKSSKLLVKAGRTISDSLDVPLEVISILPQIGQEKQNDDALDQIEEIHSFAKSVHGQMQIFFSDDNPAITVAAYCAKTKPSCLVVGFPGENSNSFIDFIHELLPSMTISMVDGEKIYNIMDTELGEGQKELKMPNLVSK